MLGQKSPIEATFAIDRGLRGHSLLQNPLFCHNCAVWFDYRNREFLQQSGQAGGLNALIFSSLTGRIGSYLREIPN